MNIEVCANCGAESDYDLSVTPCEECDHWTRDGKAVEWSSDLDPNWKPCHGCRQTKHVKDMYDEGLCQTCHDFGRMYE